MEPYTLYNRQAGNCLMDLMHAGSKRAQEILKGNTWLLGQAFVFDGEVYEVYFANNEGSYYEYDGMLDRETDLHTDWVVRIMGRSF